MARNKKRDPEGFAIPAGLFIGMGIGLLTGNIAPWLFIGLGAGFLFVLFFKLMKKR